MANATTTGIMPTIRAIAPTPTTEIERQQAIENALSAAPWHVRHGTGYLSIQAATGRAVRAVSMLKQACTEATMQGSV